MQMPGIRVSESAWPAIEKTLESGADALLPIGATCKQHGRHLPANTDFRQVDWLVEQLMVRMDVVVWPEIGYGYYPAFADYPGSVSLSESTYRLLVSDILDCIEAAGAQRIVILNSGVSTIRPLQAILTARTSGAETRLINIYSGANFTRATTDLEEQEWGGHADEIETSMMLAIDPQSVDLSKARNAPRRIRSGRFNRRRPDEPNYSPDGVNGNPRLATCEKGAQLLVAMLDDVIGEIMPGP
jgi:creatinine amidohydrolase